MPSKGNYKAVIIGAGRIASQFDSLESGEVLTHAHAFRKHPRVDLMGILDSNKNAARRAAKKWNCQTYDDLDTMMRKVQPDIVNVCTPDSSHFGVLLKIAHYKKTRIVICEKPITTNLADTKKIVRLYDTIGIPILVNYSRRFDAVVQKLRQSIRENKYGGIVCASGIYTKGIVHNGAHMIDLCRYLFGEVTSVVTTFSVPDFSHYDKSVSGCLEFKLCKQFHLMSGDERRYSIFEIDILFEKRRVRFIDFGFCVSIQKVTSDPRYAGYQCLGKPVIKSTSLDRAMVVLVDNAVLHLRRQSPLLCGIDDSLETQKICELLLHGKKFKKYDV
ncbi:MAG: hypothetical protein A2W52_01005 [Candidatus Taylorbacteria bacterium RIFCSPHIGHO2_02_49_25]|uniref:Gfo/Idh/MocA-like oxidoreductase N-terminal domain-containing protein n=1 Tax=Candidatus Taylorbacteria bacterium RIFCSPHIGHO2_02_49_25 TaxID=1802305 RepID=A0A1G2MD53_9BACT|nr:MAG: Oxidoreductase domain protein [Parcubacteria group bacterium GW2011_GWF2_50_9]OHA20962.1 MAG: hypothetical protein A2W52_01005 [Candidatus Taylorbacteria bacterium RIFCSPHIGHO2_02_49_25]OHA37023.1 MAG: hypothetical protein A3B27_03005 [Candidatus Taylorbacteria bacterium RIFCSPLOWO2_01_FULL_50_130]OHA37261.1 MAG: hypothetical protein A2W65_03250 [Candidatus Taylorbacteria bacterium RIFCSPLOWO2_02_50_13]OHA40025.1 MAG: hypothetical protein A3H73_03590 [Candidatus Taylorbacteria bacterium